jgi:hypothetical protein
MEFRVIMPIISLPMRCHMGKPIDRENQPLVTNELVELKNNWFKFKTLQKQLIVLDNSI